jgi:hypothetical protein
MLAAAKQSLRNASADAVLQLLAFRPFTCPNGKALVACSWNVCGGRCASHQVCVPDFCSACGARCLNVTLPAVPAVSAGVAAKVRASVRGLLTADGGVSLTARRLQSLGLTSQGANATRSAIAAVEASLAAKLSNATRALDAAAARLAANASESYAGAAQQLAAEILEVPAHFLTNAAQLGNASRQLARNVSWANTAAALRNLTRFRSTAGGLNASEMFDPARLKVGERRGARPQPSGGGGAARRHLPPAIGAVRGKGSAGPASVLPCSHLDARASEPAAVPAHPTRPAQELAKGICQVPNTVWSPWASLSGLLGAANTNASQGPACAACPAGAIASLGDLRCTVCWPGTARPSGAEACSKCAAGYYADTFAAAACEVIGPCVEAGLWAAGVLCEWGRRAGLRFGAAQRQPPCLTVPPRPTMQPCPINSFSPITGAWGCIKVRRGVTAHVPRCQTCMFQGHCTWLASNPLNTPAPAQPYSTRSAPLASRRPYRARPGATLRGSDKAPCLAPSPSSTQRHAPANSYNHHRKAGCGSPAGMSALLVWHALCPLKRRAAIRANPSMRDFWCKCYNSRSSRPAGGWGVGQVERWWGRAIAKQAVQCGPSTGSQRQPHSADQAARARRAKGAQQRRPNEQARA